MLKEQYSSLSLGVTIHELPEEHPMRRKVDAALTIIRRFDETRGKRYTMDRTGSEYMSQLLGLEYMFAHLAQQSGPPVLVDVGAGMTRGASDLASLAEKYGLDMQATVVTPIPMDQKKVLPSDKIHLTSAEYLDGFGKESVRGILSLAAITYSAVPELAVARMDQVLVPGGILKAAFSITDAVCYSPGMYLKNRAPFEKELKNLGYGIGIDDKTSEQFDIVLAVKPGGNPYLSAQALLNYDADDYLGQIHDLVYNDNRGIINLQHFR